jgi:hypothetical protein
MGSSAAGEPALDVGRLGEHPMSTADQGRTKRRRPWTLGHAEPHLTATLSPAPASEPSLGVI